jgi:hypothetical protein
VKQFSAKKLAATEQSKACCSEKYVHNFYLAILLIEISQYQDIPLEGLALDISFSCHQENKRPVGRVSCFV